MKASDLLYPVVGVGDDYAIPPLSARNRRVLMELPLDGWVVAGTHRDGGQDRHRTLIRVCTRRRHGRVRNGNVEGDTAKC